MDKHTVIVIVASIVIALPFVYGGLNIYGAEQIQFVSSNQEKFSYFEIINNGKISFCNPLPFYVTFDKLEVIMIFDQVEKGTLNIQGMTLPPSSITPVEGNFKSELFEEIQYLALHFDGMFSGATIMRIDPNKLIILTETHTSLLGIIPYSVTKQFSALDFWSMMNDKDGQYNC